MKKTKRKETEFKELLRNYGYKVTPLRVNVLSIINGASRPLSPNEVIRALGGNGDQSSVYRFLKALKSQGLLRQVDFRHDHPHYEAADTNDHHHLICVSCGTSEEIRGCGADRLRRSVLRQARRFGEIREHSLEFYGFCNSCLKHPVRRTPAHAPGA